MSEGNDENGAEVVSMEVEGGKENNPRKPGDDKPKLSTRIVRAIAAALIGFNFLISSITVWWVAWGAMGSGESGGVALFFYLIVEAVMLPIVLILSAFAGNRRGRFVVWSLLSIALPAIVLVLFGF